MMATQPTDMNAVLDLPMEDNDAAATTIRDYLGKLLELVWQETEGFDGKRPFGNSDWTSDLYPPLVKAGFVDGAVSEDGYHGDIDEAAADRLIAAAITSMRERPVALGVEDYQQALGQIRNDVAAARKLLAQHDCQAAGFVVPMTDPEGK